MNAEARLITAICEQKAIAPALAAGIDDMFVTHRDVWEKVKNHYFEYQSVPTLDTLVRDCADFEPTPAPDEPKYYIDEMRNSFVNAQLESIIKGAVKNHGVVPGKQLVEGLLRRVSGLAKEADLIRDLNLTDIDNAAAYYERKRQRAIERGGAVGIMTGFKTMDALYPTGLAGGHLAVIIGWSGHGKSWFGTLLACRAWAQGYKPMIVSLEMSPEEVRDRAYTIMGDGTFQHSNFARGMVNLDGFDRWASKSLSGQSDFVVVSSEGAGSVTPSTVQTKIDQHRPDLVILDYQQLFDSDEGGQSEVVSNRKISREFKRMAVRNDIPVVNLSQATFSDPKDTEEPPRIEQVAWSKGIQQDADLALAVHKYSDSDVWSIIARKNRHGEEFQFGLDWSLNDGVMKESI
jgi:replicative DNA helicase